MTQLLPPAQNHHYDDDGNNDDDDHNDDDDDDDTTIAPAQNIVESHVESVTSFYPIRGAPKLL